MSEMRSYVEEQKLEMEKAHAAEVEDVLEKVCTSSDPCWILQCHGPGVVPGQKFSPVFFKVLLQVTSCDFIKINAFMRDVYEH